MDYAIYGHQHQMPHYPSSVLEINCQDKHFGQRALTSDKKSWVILLTPINATM